LVVWRRGGKNHDLLLHYLNLSCQSSNGLCDRSDLLLEMELVSGLLLLILSLLILCVWVVLSLLLHLNVMLIDLMQLLRLGMYVLEQGCHRILLLYTPGITLRLLHLLYILRVYLKRLGEPSKQLIVIWQRLCLCLIPALATSVIIQGIGTST
jgi:hypothetical protein